MYDLWQDRASLSSFLRLGFHTFPFEMCDRNVATTVYKTWQTFVMKWGHIFLIFLTKYIYLQILQAVITFFHSVWFSLFYCVACTFIDELTDLLTFIIIFLLCTLFISVLICLIIYFSLNCLLHCIVAVIVVETEAIRSITVFTQLSIYSIINSKIDLNYKPTLLSWYCLKFWLSIFDINCYCARGHLIHSYYFVHFSVSHLSYFTHSSQQFGCFNHIYLIFVFFTKWI